MTWCSSRERLWRNQRPVMTPTITGGGVRNGSGHSDSQTLTSNNGYAHNGVHPGRSVERLVGGLATSAVRLAVVRDALLVAAASRAAVLALHALVLRAITVVTVAAVVARHNVRKRRVNFVGSSVKSVLGDTALADLGIGVAVMLERARHVDASGLDLLARKVQADRAVDVEVTGQLLRVGRRLALVCTESAHKPSAKYPPSRSF